GIVDDQEYCDDGNREDGDGCTHNCQEIEDGYFCPANGGPCVFGSACGDGHLDPGEECDFDIEFGNPQNGDGCSTSCTVEPGYTCNEWDCAPYYCGNGVLEGEEECEYYSEDMTTDYGTNSDGERGCTINCKFAPYCGDGIVQSDHEEECDLGKDNNTADEYGIKEGCRSNCKLPYYCGDGVFTHSIINSLGEPVVTEECDPTVPGSAEGCNEDCTHKPGYLCHATTGICTEASSIKCGDDSIDGVEECDQNGNGCTSCKHDTDYKCIGSMTAPCTTCAGSSNYNNFPCCTKELGQQCQKISKGYGDGILDPDGFEECDDGNTKDGDGCSSVGKIEEGFVCRTPGKACESICGDGKRVAKEECDDGNKKGGDGCSANCTMELGYYCKTPGTPCALDTCNNGFVGPNEICDGGAGCGSDCQSLKSGYCFSKSKGVYSCGSSHTCGNYILEPGEQCDDGNSLGGDGCDANCKVEYGYECPTGIDCRAKCGDGSVMWQLGEKCDLGSDNGKGKGCSVTCQIEKGFTCTDPKPTYPDTVDLDVTYRDFIGMNSKGTSNGYVSSALVSELTAKDSSLSANNKCGRTMLSADKSWFDNTPIIAKYMVNSKWLNAGYGFPDFQGFTGNLCFGLVEDTLDANGKPVLTSNLDGSCCGKMVNSDGTPNTACNNFNSSNNSGKNLSYDGAYYNYGYNGWYNPSKAWRRYHMLCGSAFAKWYTTDSRINQEIPGKLTLTKETGQKYVYNAETATTDKYFAPIDNKGFGNTTYDANGKVVNHNGNFTTEISTYFQYKGGEKLNFNGDDDLWVFINGKLFLDMGGYHAKVEGWNTLSTKTCSSQDLKNGGTISRKCDERYGIYEDGLYELKVFHAEREASGSNFKLTLDGFINPTKVTCSSSCGDGITTSSEQCDISDATAANALGCVNCLWNKSVCGNGRIEGNEACDTGWLCKDSKYSAACADLKLAYEANERCDEQTCKYKDNLCGNGTKDPGEDCDSSSDPKCNPNTCKWYCGDGIVQTEKGEECDLGSKNKDDGTADCTTKCKSPYCGDGVVSSLLGEECDDGVNNATYGEGKCMAGCARTAPYCGDKVIQADHGEECDLGKDKNTGTYGGCNPNCTRAAYCGDGHLDAGEECDPKDSATMTGCTDNCTKEIN
ncbi:MAG: DUF4215 domain-containing protein, partial [Proteobacteria bacterium]|nr:DUF4215 domain-containing protein [Pseudomonadota bacterium]